MNVTRLEIEMETDWLARQIGFVTDPDGVVTVISRCNRAQLLPQIEERDATVGPLGVYDGRCGDRIGGAA